jgi:hypothetical protein
MFNAQSLKSKDKLLHLHALLYSRVFDVILITETWLNTSIPSGLLDPDNLYNVIRCDRQHGQGGGVCAFVSKFLEIVEVPVTKHFPNLEICCFEVLFRYTRCRVFTTYRRPERDCTSMEYMTQLLAVLQSSLTPKFRALLLETLIALELIGSTQYLRLIVFK